MSMDKLSYLKQILNNSTHTVALCGSGMLKECGLSSLKSPNYSYEIEEKYGVSPEYIYTSAYFNTRPEKFYEFFKEEMLSLNLTPGPSSYAMAELERLGLLKCIITTNVFELDTKAGCQNVIHLHGTANHFICPHCQRIYAKDYVLSSEKVPRCESCGYTIRPKLLLYGEMLDSQIMTRTALEVEKADTLLLLGTTLESDVFHHYIKYFSGNNLVLIHKEPHHQDYRADLVIPDEPENVLPRLVNPF